MLKDLLTAKIMRDGDFYPPATYKRIGGQVAAPLYKNQ
jgi:hypothetical protein